LSTARPSDVSTSRAALSRSTKPRTTIAVTVVPVTPGLRPFGAAGEAEEQDALRGGEIGSDDVRGVLIIDLAKAGRDRSQHRLRNRVLLDFGTAKTT
jgi:hypothetical protein